MGAQLGKSTSGCGWHSWMEMSQQMALAQLGRVPRTGEGANLELGHSWMALHSWIERHSWMEWHSWRRGHHSHLANIWIEWGIEMLPIPFPFPPPPNQGFQDGEEDGEVSASAHSWIAPANIWIAPAAAGQRGRSLRYSLTNP